MHPVLSLEHEVLEAALPAPIQNAHTRWSERRSVLVTLEDASGECGRGEAAPLPGISPESLEDVLVALERLGSSVAPSELDLRSLPPSLRFAIESALLDLRAGERPAYAALLGSQGETRVPETIELQVLLDSLETAETRARSAFAAGARTFKVKVGRPGAAQAEAELLELVRSLGRDVVIRADANGRLDDVDVLAPALARARAEYLEDPFTLDDGVPRAWVGIPLALDAAVGADPFAALARARSLGASFVVLKPTVLGGLEVTLALAARARSRGLKVVLSHCLEGPVGLAALAHLALAASAASHRALWGAQGLAPWPGCDAFRRPGGEPPALPYRLSQTRVRRPASRGSGAPRGSVAAES